MCDSKLMTHYTTFHERCFTSHGTDNLTMASRISSQIQLSFKTEGRPWSSHFAGAFTTKQQFQHTTTSETN